MDGPRNVKYFYHGIMDMCEVKRGISSRYTPFDVTHPEPTFTHYHAYNDYQKVMRLSLRLATKTWNFFLPFLSKLVEIDVKLTSVSCKYLIAFIFLHVQSFLWSMIIVSTCIDLKIYVIDICWSWHYVQEFQLQNMYNQD